MRDVTIWILIFIVIVAIILFTNNQKVTENFFLYYPDCYYNASNNLICNPYQYWPDFWALNFWMSSYDYPKSYLPTYNMEKELANKNPVQWQTPEPVTWKVKPKMPTKCNSF